MGEPNESAAARKARREGDKLGAGSQVGMNGRTQKPSVGRAVHFFQNATQPYALAATVAYVHGDTRVNLGYLSGNGVAMNATQVEYSETSTHAPRWCWPPRV